MPIKILVVRMASKKFEVEPKDFAGCNRSPHTVEISGHFAQDLYDLLVAAIAEYNRTIDEGGK